MHEKLIAYFSASGVTSRAARALAQATNADLYEIVPETRYTNADLDWQNKKSRSSIEMNDPASRPAIAGQTPDMARYDTVFVGFPIWWYTAPTIVKTFLEACDLKGKNIVLFATSGGSNLGKTAQDLAPSCPGATIRGGKMLNGRLSPESLKAWADGIG